MAYSAVIVAAGQGIRMHLGYNKAYYHLDGRTVLEHAMDCFIADRDCVQIILVTDKDVFAEKIGQVSARIQFARGGRTRQESVANGLALVTSPIVMIHDGARPYLQASQLMRLKEAMAVEQAACLAVPVKDTIKIVDDGCIVSTPDRRTLMAAQTPQAFRTDLIRRCMARAERDGFEATDDCSLVEKYGGIQIRIVEGSYENVKITTPEDVK